MNIERLTDDDLTPLAEMFQQFWGEKSSLENMRKTFSRLAANPAYILLAAKQNDRLAGFAMGIICEELYGDCKPFMVIEDLIVDNTQQRKGVGSALMRELEKCAVDQNCCQIVFVTEAGRTQAHRFYESLGYESESYKGFKKKMKSGHQNSL
jgi:ribosomal protein S18 acetylase RimI-like enzyme